MERTGTSYFPKKCPYFRQIPLQNQLKNIPQGSLLFPICIFFIDLDVLLRLHSTFEIFNTKKHILEKFEKMQKKSIFWHIFSSNCCQYWKIEFRCLVYPKTFIFYPKKMKTSERKQFWKIRNCAPLEALWVGGSQTHPDATQICYKLYLHSMRHISKSWYDPNIECLIW